jgi:hypothetical protein
VVESVGGGWTACMTARLEALTSTLVGEGYHLSAKALLALLFPYQYTTFLLRSA